jgi:hypothetical protein
MHEGKSVLTMPHMVPWPKVPEQIIAMLTRVPMPKVIKQLVMITSSCGCMMGGLVGG